MIKLELKYTYTCDCCKTSMVNDPSNPITFNVFPGIELPRVYQADLPNGWGIITLWIEGYYRCFCPKCATKFAEKMKEIGVE